MTPELIGSTLSASIHYATPLLCACLAGLWSERSGIVDIGLEGKLLISAFVGALAADMSGNAWIGLAGGLTASVVFALIHGFASIDQRGNQIVSGVAINMIAAGATALVGNAIYGRGGQTPSLTGAAKFQDIHWPGVEAVQNVPVIGIIYRFVISGHTAPVYLALLAVFVTSWALQRSRFGLRLRAVGENPAAVDVAGISVRALRYRAVIICGLICGLGGVYLSVAANGSFLRDMSAGNGFIALAALVFAKWRPFPALFTCLLFGFLDAFADRIQGQSLPFIGEVPVQAIQALPYLLTVILLAGFIGKAVPPKASGIPYVKER